MTDPNSTLIAVLLDRSGSMVSTRSDMEGGFDTFIRQQREEAPPNAVVRVTLAQFDSQYETVYSNRPIADVPPLQLVPRGSTALLDGIGRLTNTVGAELAEMEENNRPSRVLVVVITDGMENSSREFTKDKIQELISQQENVWNWTYVFIGANMDAVSVGGGLGFGSNLAPGSAHTHSLTYEQTSAGTRGAFVALAGATMDWMESEPERGGAAFAFTDEHRERARGKIDE